jgi:precorrin-2 dehydrogenase / sirohydrochlorin ferrochelatase
VSLFPMFLKLEDRACLVIGAGTIGEPKIRSLLQAKAEVRVVAPHATAAVAAWAQAGVLTWHSRNFVSGDLEGVFLVIAATNSRDVNEEVFREAQRHQILCNVVDDPEHCDFFYPAVVRRGQLQFAISTGGRSPALAQRLRRELETQFRPEYAGWVEELGDARQKLRASHLNPETTKRQLHKLASQEAFEAHRSHTGDIHER